MPSFVDTFNNVGIAAFGITMPVLNPAWASGALPTADAAAMSLTLGSGDWVSPCSAITAAIASAGDLRVTLISATGSAITGPGLLLTLPPQLYLRLRRLYGAVLEGGAAQPVRPVPRHFFYAGASSSDASGVIRAGESLSRTGALTIHDGDGMPIDPLAVAAAFAAILDAHHVLEQHAALGDPYAAPTQLTQIAGLGGAAAVHVRLSDFAGAPYAGDHLEHLTAVAAGSGLFSVAAGATITKEAATAAGGAFPATERDRLVLGPATTGTLGDSFAPTAAAVTLARDFFSLRVVALGPYLIGTPAAGFLGTRLERRPEVRLHESITLLGDGNEVLGAAQHALDGADEAMCAAQAIRGHFPLPPSIADAHWPSFPAPAPALDAHAPLPLRPDAIAPTAQYLVDGTGVWHGDVVVTLDGLPPSAAVRAYNRRFLADAREGRGDGAGAVVPDGASSVTLRLTDPFGLQPPGAAPGPLAPPDPGTLHFDLLVVRRNVERDARLYGNLTVVMPASATTATAPPEPPANAFDLASHAGLRLGVSNAGVLGLGASALAALPSDPGMAAIALAGEANPRDQSRLPTMARREVLVTGRVAGAWRAVVSAGRLTEEMASAEQRLGAPGGRGGRETQAAGVATEGGLLAYDVMRMALRRTTNIVDRLSVLTGDHFTEPAAATGGSFAAAALQTVAPYCETPELAVVRSLLTDPSLLPATLTDLVDLVHTWIAGQAGALGGAAQTLWNQVQSQLTALASRLGSSAVANRVYDELRRELVSSCQGRRDAQWALQDAIGRARRFIYIETPGFCATQGATAHDYTADLIAALTTRINSVPGLHVMLCVPRAPDFAFGYEAAAAYELADRLAKLTALQRAGAGDPLQSRVVPFHPIGFPGRPSRIESTVVIVDDVWALVGGCTFRRRGLTFDGSADLALTDTALADGVAPTIRDFRRRLMATRLGATEASDGMHAATFARLRDGVEAFYAIKEMLIAGGLGRIELLHTGIPSGGPPPTPASIDLANPEGQEFDVGMAELLALFALLARAM